MENEINRYEGQYSRVYFFTIQEGTKVKFIVQLSKMEIREFVYQFVIWVKSTMLDKHVFWWSNWRIAHKSIAIFYHKKGSHPGVIASYR